jgi:hypothetical protein
MNALRSASDWILYAGMAVTMYGGAQWPRPSWPAVAAGVLVALGGIAARRRAGAPALEVEPLDASSSRRPPRAGTLRDALADLVHGMENLSMESQHMEFSAIKDRVEELLWLGPERVGASQEAIAAKVGFAAYAEVMAPLAASERWMNRAWSAAADGHRPECVASLTEALSFAREAEALGRERFASL